MDWMEDKPIVTKGERDKWKIQIHTNPIKREKKFVCPAAKHCRW